MVVRYPRVQSGSTFHESAGRRGYRTNVGVRKRGWLLVGALVLGAVVSVLFMKPVFLAPVAGDDRVWYPEMGALESWSVPSELGQLPQAPS